MKKHNGWWIEDEENFHKVLSVLDQESFSCKPILESALKYVNKFEFAIDIGTWIGDSTLMMCEKFSWVWAFEANPSLIECCNQNLKDRNIDNFALLNYAISNTRQDQNFYTGPKSSSGGWIGTNKDALYLPKYSVTCRLLDDFNFTDIDFIKIDVDSHEGFLLQGSKNFFKKNNPVVAIEYKDTKNLKSRQEQNCPDPLQILKNWGYSTKEKIGNNDYIMTRD